MYGYTHHTPPLFHHTTIRQHVTHVGFLKGAKRIEEGKVMLVIAIIETLRLLLMRFLDACRTPFL